MDLAHTVVVAHKTLSHLEQVCVYSLVPASLPVSLLTRFPSRLLLRFYVMVHLSEETRLVSTTRENQRGPGIQVLDPTCTYNYLGPDST